MSRRETKFYIKTGLISIFLVIIVSYGFYEIWNYIIGPEIVISAPTDGAAVAESLITITGQANRAQEITLNDRPIVVNEFGEFSEKLLLSYGYNILTLKAWDRFGKNVEKRLQIVYK